MTVSDGGFKILDRYHRLVLYIVPTLIVAVVIVLAVVSFGRFLLAPAIVMEPERMKPFDGPVCPGSSSTRTITYVINRSGILEIDGVIYDLNKLRPVPDTAISTTRPAPYQVKESMPFTFTVPDLPSGRYEWQIGVSSKNLSAQTAWWFVEFEVADGCDVEGP